MIDDLDRKLLAVLQTESSNSLDQLGELVGLSRNACWRRIKRLEDIGIIKKQVTLLDAARLNVGQTVFISIKAVEHSNAWLETFARAVKDIPEMVGVFRMSGDTDYLIQAVVPNVPAYDALYKRLIDRVTLADVSSAFVMEEIKATTALPLNYAARTA